MAKNKQQKNENESQFAYKLLSIKENSLTQTNTHTHIKYNKKTIVELLMVILIRHIFFQRNSRIVCSCGVLCILPIINV